EVSYADENDRLQTGRAQFIGNHFRQLDHIVAEPAGAELPEVSEVFAKLSGFHAGDFGERFAGDGLNFVVPQPRQTTQVNRQPVNRLARNLRSMELLQGREN